ARADAGGADAGLGAHAQDHRLRHPRHRGSGLPRRSRRRHERAPGPHPRGSDDRPAPAAGAGDQEINPVPRVPQPHLGPDPQRVGSLEVIPLSSFPPAPIDGSTGSHSMKRSASSMTRFQPPFRTRTPLAGNVSSPSVILLGSDYWWLSTP